jgi:cytochrome c peroxidase
MRTLLCTLVVAVCLLSTGFCADKPPGPDPLLGLPPVPYPEDNPQTPEKIALGDKLFHDARFSTTGKISCSSCHLDEKAFTDSPLKVSEGIRGLTGTRNAPTVVNAAYFETLFLDGRSPSLEEQSLHPFTNPVEMGLENHDPILEIVRTDPEYVEAFKKVFGKSGEEITMDEVTAAIGSFERTVVGGNSPFDRWRYAGESGALTDAQKRGFDLFINKGRCVSCLRWLPGNTERFAKQAFARQPRGQVPHLAPLVAPTRILPKT